MAPNASTFLALRYLRPKRSFVSVITIISLLGVAVGVLMMIVVKSVMLGFDADFRETLLGAEPHLLLEKAEAAGDWEGMLMRAQQEAAAVSAAAYAGGILYAKFGEGQAGFPVFGLDPKAASAQVEKLRQHLDQGSLDLADGTVVVSDFAARQLGAALGDEITVYESAAVNRAAQQFKVAMNEVDAKKKEALHRQISLNSQKVRLAGIYRGESGGFYAYTSLKTGQTLFRLGEGVSGIAVELKTPYEALEIGERLAPEGSGWKVKTWLDEGEARLAAMRNEQIMMTIILWIIAVVAAFSVMNTTITVTTQKRKEIGVLTALGCRPMDIVRIFVTKAAIIGGVGVVMGVSLSLLVLWLRNDIRGVIASLTSSQVHAIEGVFLAEIPAQISLANVLLATGGSFVMCLVAAFLPAWFAARLDPAVALRD
jgi:lipoprotein-releasing system permease protein